MYCINLIYNPKHFSDKEERRKVNTKLDEDYFPGNGNTYNERLKTRKRNMANHKPEPPDATLNNSEGIENCLTLEIRCMFCVWWSFSLKFNCIY